MPADLYDRIAAWQLATFGTRQTVAGLLAHIRKELDEVERDPADLVEWADLFFFVVQGASRFAGADGAAFFAAHGAGATDARLSEVLGNVHALLGGMRALLSALAINPADKIRWVRAYHLVRLGAAAYAGADDRAFFAAVEAKLAKNEGRRWVVPASPDLPVEHDRSGE